MSTLNFNWVNATTRQDGSALAPTDIGSSIVSLVNGDASLTPVATVPGSATTATAPAPATAGVFNYVVQNVDQNNDVGAQSPPASVTIAAPPLSAPSAPSGLTVSVGP